MTSMTSILWIKNELLYQDDKKRQFLLFCAFVNIIVPMLHFSPRKPAAQPFEQTPEAWWQGAPPRQLAHSDSHPAPYVPSAHPGGDNMFTRYVYVNSQNVHELILFSQKYNHIKILKV